LTVEAKVAIELIFRKSLRFIIEQFFNDNKCGLT
jgi:hypothetical protein